MQHFFTIVLLGSLFTVSLAVMRTAKCDVEVNTATPDIDDQVTGTVTFEQEDEGPVTVSISLSGFNTTNDYAKHGFHVHETGDISGGCGDAGGHYNPEGVKHGDRTADVRHVGDLGNIEEDDEGNVDITFTDDVISLTGDHNIIPRAIVVHQQEDDLGLGGDPGSEANGNAGPRISCCVIEDTSSGAATIRPYFTLSFLLTLLVMAKNIFM